LKPVTATTPFRPRPIPSRASALVGAGRAAGFVRRRPPSRFPFGERRETTRGPPLLLRGSHSESPKMFQSRPPGTRYFGKAQVRRFQVGYGFGTIRSESSRLPSAPHRREFLFTGWTGRGIYLAVVLFADGRSFFPDFGWRLSLFNPHKTPNLYCKSRTILSTIRRSLAVLCSSKGRTPLLVHDFRRTLLEEVPERSLQDSP